MMRFAKRALARALFGAIGGFVAWVMTEHFITDPRSPEEFSRPLSEETRSMALFGFAVGGCIGAALAGLEELFWGSPQRAGRLVSGAVLLGGLGGAIASIIANFVFNLFPYEFGELSLWLIVARTFGWAVLGALLGVALGATRKSRKGALNAGLGGLLGGAAGGLLFDTIAPYLGMVIAMGLAEPGWGSRLIGLTLLGGLIGLFITFAEQFLAPASLKVVSSGRMEGREFVIDKPVVMIGRDERCDVTLYYDRDVLGRHAVLQWGEDRYFIVPEGSATVQVNNQPARHQGLSDGDFITIGQTRLLFRMRKPIAVVVAEKPCPKCGTRNRPAAKFCHRCGQPLS